MSDRANAVYLVTVADCRYALKAYALGERLPDDLGYEMDLLLHLARSGMSVATPVAARDGRYVATLRANGGNRFAVLYTYAPGDPPPWPPDAAYYRPYGRAVAAIHSELDDFASAHPRPPLDLEHLVEGPVRAMLPLLRHRPDDAVYLRRLADDLAAASGRSLRISTGARATADGIVTFFDFECCGAGWRAYDLATFRWDVTFNGADDYSDSEGRKMVYAPAKSWTAEDLERLSAQGWRAELWKGQLIRMVPTGDLHGRVTKRLDRALDRYIAEHELGEMWPAEAGFDLTRPGEPRQTVLAADITFVRAARVPPPVESFVPVVPDLVVETASPSQSRPEMGGKARQWLERGVPLMWVVWPARRRIDEWRQGEDAPRALRPGATLDGYDIVPGFSAPVADLFA